MRLKLLAIVVLLVISGGAIAVAMGGFAPAASSASTLLMAAASVADVTDEIAATGSIEAANTYDLSFGSATASTTVAWSVKEVKVAVGDRVAAGQVLATADTTNLDAQIADATRAASSASIQLSQARTDRAAATTTATRRQTQVSLYNAETADARAKTLLADLKAQRARPTIAAPVDGIVTAVAITAGANAPAGAAISMISAGLRVTTNVVESDVAAIKIGQEATVTVVAVDASLRGKVTSIDPVGSGTGSNGVVSFAVRIQLDAPPAGLRPGMTADVTIVAASATGVLSIPSRALSGTGGAYTVRVVSADGTVSARLVQVGLVTSSLTEIKSGLQAGDLVVTGTSSAQNAATNLGGGGGGVGGGGVFPGGGVVHGRTGQ
ncbi:MAG: efflux RND transporter periplasmic adaptor subunit [Chloroflexi bacterium]|nr:efflux RND transporter periplasmic adaptor subunit [Chloroflexota bacterium]